MKFLKLKQRFSLALLIIIVLAFAVVLNNIFASVTAAKNNDENIGEADYNEYSEEVKSDNLSNKNIENDNNSEKNIIVNSSYYTLDIDAVLQNPELPTGCEVTSLATVLNYYGCSVDKTYLAENYLEKGEAGCANPNTAFIGSPFSEYSYGCYAGVIVNSAKEYIFDNAINLSVSNVTGTEFEMLENYVKQGCPVIFWATMNMVEPYESIVWNIDGEEIAWLANEHCMVLIGYNYETDCYIVSDPLVGITEYNSEILKLRYNQMGSQAIVIQ